MPVSKDAPDSKQYTKIVARFLNWGIRDQASMIITEGEKLKEVLSIHAGDDWSSFVQMVIKSRGFLESLITRLEKHPEQVFAGQND